MKSWIPSQNWDPGKPRIRLSPHPGSNTSFNILLVFYMKYTLAEMKRPVVLLKAPLLSIALLNNWRQGSILVPFDSFLCEGLLKCHFKLNIEENKLPPIIFPNEQGMVPNESLHEGKDTILPPVGHLRKHKIWREGGRREVWVWGRGEGVGGGGRIAPDWRQHVRTPLLQVSDFLQKSASSHNLQTEISPHTPNIPISIGNHFVAYY